MSAYHVAPRDQGQIVEVAWASGGEDGVVERITDRSDQSVCYRLHPWLVADRHFDPWNGSPEGVSCSRRSRKITPAEARQLTEDAE